MEKKKNTLTVILSSHQRTTESLRMWGQASLAPWLLGSGPVPSLPRSLLIWNTGPQHHFTHPLDYRGDADPGSEAGVGGQAREEGALS